MPEIIKIIIAFLIAIHPSEKLEIFIPALPRVASMAFIPAPEGKSCPKCGLNMIKVATRFYATYPEQIKMEWWCEKCKYQEDAEIFIEKTLEEIRKNEWLRINPGQK